MKKLLVVVDMQNDFITGALGTKEAENIVPKVADKILNWEGDIIFTRDTHNEDYLHTKEGLRLPKEHCIKETNGWEISDEIDEALISTFADSILRVDKSTFGSTAIPELIRHCNYDYIELVGLCTDVCVVSNALLLRANFPEMSIAVDASCCAGITPEGHEAALAVMNRCQIDIYESDDFKHVWEISINE